MEILATKIYRDSQSVCGHMVCLEAYNASKSLQEILCFVISRGIRDNPNSCHINIHRVDVI